MVKRSLRLPKVPASQGLALQQLAEESTDLEVAQKDHARQSTAFLMSQGHQVLLYCHALARALHTEGLASQQSSRRGCLAFWTQGAT